MLRNLPSICITVGWTITITLSFNKQTLHYLENANNNKHYWNKNPKSKRLYHLNQRGYRPKLKQNDANPYYQKYKA